MDDLHYHGTGPERGIDMGRNLVDVMPILVVSKSDEVTSGIYTRAEVDSGTIKDYNCIFSDLDMENAHGLFREMYGSVGSFLYIVKTAINSEQRVADEMYACLHGSGSMVALQGEIMSILHPPAMRGYVFVESSALHHVEKLIGRSGGRDPSARLRINQSPLKNAKNVLPGEAPARGHPALLGAQGCSPAALRSAASSKSSRVPSRAKKPASPAYRNPRKRSAWNSTSKSFR